MSEEHSFEHPPGPSWKRLTALESRGGDADRQIVDWVVETAQKVGIQPQQLARIRTSIAEAIRHTRRGARASGRILTLRLQMWTWNAPVLSQEEAGGARPCVPNEPLSWGFFIVERQNEVPESGGIEPSLVVDLYLYREPQVRRSDACEPRPPATGVDPPQDDWRGE